MNNYETIFLLNINISKEKRQKILDKVIKCISKYGKITNIEEIGEKKLAYEIKKQKEAFYYNLSFEANPQCIYTLEYLYRITDEILKFITVRIDF